MFIKTAFTKKGYLTFETASFFVIMHFVYIIYSKTASKFYVGETPNIENRLKIHNDIALNTNYTKSGIPWELFYSIKVADRIVAKKIETHIKKMKSKTYIKNLKQYPEITSKLINQYS